MSLPTEYAGLTPLPPGSAPPPGPHPIGPSGPPPPFPEWGAVNPWFLAEQQDRAANASLAEREGFAYQSPTVMPGRPPPWVTDHNPFRPAYPDPPTLDRGGRAFAMARALGDVSSFFGGGGFPGHGGLPWDGPFARARAAGSGSVDADVRAVEAAVAALVRLDALMSRFAESRRPEGDGGPRQRPPFFGPNPPPFALVGDQWISSRDGRMYVRWPGDAWVELAGNTRTVPVEIPVVPRPPHGGAWSSWDRPTWPAAPPPQWPVPIQPFAPAAAASAAAPVPQANAPGFIAAGATTPTPAPAVSASTGLSAPLPAGLT